MLLEDQVTNPTEFASAMAPQAKVSRTLLSITVSKLLSDRPLSVGTHKTLQATQQFATVDQSFEFP